MVEDQRISWYLRCSIMKQGHVSPVTARLAIWLSTHDLWKPWPEDPRAKEEVVYNRVIKGMWPNRPTNGLIGVMMVFEGKNENAYEDFKRIYNHAVDPITKTTCPECNGNKTVDSIAGLPLMNRIKCPTCQGLGYIYV